MQETRTLHIVRHGKSSWDYGMIDDIDRPLKERGIREAYSVSLRLKKNGKIPERIISSMADRAVHTAMIYLRALNLPVNIFTVSEALYQADIPRILSLISINPDNIYSLMIVGHNPVFTELANFLSGSELENLPTNGIASLEFKCDSWNKIGKECLVNAYIDFPKKS